MVENKERNYISSVTSGVLGFIACLVASLMFRYLYEWYKIIDTDDYNIILSLLSIFLFVGINLLVIIFLFLNKYKKTAILGLLVLMLTNVIFENKLPLLLNEGKIYFYDTVENKILESNTNMSQTSIYKEFLEHKRNLSTDGVIKYSKNLDEYISATKEDIDALKEIHIKTRDNYVRNKISYILKDGVITVQEYKNFKEYISDMNFD